MLGFIHRTHLAVGTNDFGADEVVTRKTALSHEPAHATAERQTGDPGAGDFAAGRGQANGLGGTIEVTPCSAALRSNAPALAVDFDRPHLAEIDDQAPVANAVAGDAVTAAANCDEHAGVGRNTNRVDNIVNAGAAQDGSRTAIDHAVPDRAGLIVGVVGRQDDAAAHLL